MELKIIGWLFFVCFLAVLVWAVFNFTKKPTRRDPLGTTGNSGVPQAQSQDPNQQEETLVGKFILWMKKNYGWVFFAIIVFDLFRKFIFPNVPVEWAQWIPGFSWNTTEIIIAVVGVCFLWKKTSKKNEADSQTGGDKKGHEAGKVMSKKTFSAMKLAIAAGLCFAAYSLYQYQMEHVGDLVSKQMVACQDKNFPGTKIEIKASEVKEKCVDATAPKIIKSGYFYVPIHGLLFASAVVMFVVIFEEVFSFLGFLTAIAFYAIFLPIGMYCEWFMPHTSDILVPWWNIAVGVSCLSIPILKLDPGKWYLQQQLFGFVPSAVIAVFLPQLFL